MNNKKTTKDILKEVMASVYNKKVSDIQIESIDQYKKKKNIIKNKEIKKNNPAVVSNNEGLKIFASETSHVDWRDISKSRRTCKIKESLEEWGAFDFYYFVKNLYHEKYGEEFNLRIGGSSVEINKIRDKLSDFSGFISNLIMRDYIVYFFNNHMDFYKSKYGFYFSQMRRDEHISYFIDHYDYQSSFNAYTKNEKKSEGSIKISASEISKSFRVSTSTMICAYGLIISMNWLLLNKKMDKEEALKIVDGACKLLKNKGQIKVVYNSTKIYSPYPLWFPFQNINLIDSVKGLFLNSDIKFDKDSNELFNFLRKESVEK